MICLVYSRRADPTVRLSEDGKQYALDTLARTKPVRPQRHGRLYLCRADFDIDAHPRCHSAQMKLTKKPTRP